MVRWDDADRPFRLRIVFVVSYPHLLSDRVISGIASAWQRKDGKTHPSSGNSSLISFNRKSKENSHESLHTPLFDTHSLAQNDASDDAPRISISIACYWTTVLLCIRSLPWKILPFFSLVSFYDHTPDLHTKQSDTHLSVVNEFPLWKFSIGLSVGIEKTSS